MATDMTVSRTILAQLGGTRFVAMTGAHHFVGGDDHLTMQLARGPKAKGKSITGVRITLTPADDYRVETLHFNRKALTVEVLDVATGVYCDNLQAVFTTQTGLYTRLLREG